ncbi:MAG: acyl-ACP desaturase [Candidatus Omnitrophica bacterium CG11_big_fil_rev_8_21_14_0_20_64_10]|nr:MAG: acyl-ACP desaturase [Candidatus Omnitrophica bacterium CG11_big_fil_rev_8_21_14_0_20_64_10]
MSDLPDQTVIQAHAEVIRGLEPFARENLSLLKSVEESWQPSDVLPDMTGEGWPEAVARLRQQARAVPDGLLVVLVGNTVTEEALPAYQTMLNRHPGVTDATGASEDGWALWTRGWTAEENRHGEILSRYLYLTGRVDLRAVEVTTQHLLRNGFDPGTGNDTYRGLVYTSFQERATKISHGNTARLANESGDPLLGKICALVTGDESRHEEAYKRFVSKIFEVDPSGAMVAFAEMMRHVVAMPARRMSDGGEGLFDRFSAVAQRIGVYTARDYAEIIEHLVGLWNVRALTGLTSAGAEAQEYLGKLADRYRALAERAAARPLPKRAERFSWLFGRSC